MIIVLGYSKNLKVYEFYIKYLILFSLFFKVDIINKSIGNSEN